MPRATQRAVRTYRRYRTLFSLHRQLSGTVPVLVFSLGKVGTTSLLEGLESELDVPVVHCHEIVRRKAETNVTIGGEAVAELTYAPVDWRGDYIRWRLGRDQQERWDIVCGVRDPLARHVSAVFQKGNAHGLFAEGLGEAEQVAHLTERLDHQVRHGDLGLDWFDRELRAVTGIDVYAEPFPHEAGYQVYEQGRFRVLLVRFEDLNRAGPQALSAFFSVDVREIPRANMADDKAYRDLYRRFLEELRVPEERLEAAYGSKLATHFYAPDELAAFRRRWTSD